MNAQGGAILEATGLDGVQINADKNEIIIDLDRPRVFTVRGIDPLTGAVKLFMLRVTAKRSLCLA